MALHFRELLMAVLMVTSVAYAAFGEAQELPSGAIIVTPTEFKWRGANEEKPLYCSATRENPCATSSARNGPPIPSIYLINIRKTKRSPLSRAFGILDLG